MGAPSWFTKMGRPTWDKGGESPSPGKTAALPAIMPKAAPGKGIPEGDRMSEVRAAALTNPPPPPPAEPAPPPPAPPVQERAAIAANRMDGVPAVAPPPQPAPPASAPAPRQPRTSMPFPLASAPEPSHAAAPARPAPRELGCPGHDDEPSTQVSPEQAARLLLLAEQSQAAIERALGRAAAPGATGADLAAARAVKASVGAITAALGSVNQAVGNLRTAVRRSAPASLTAAQAAAIDTFARCALDAAEASRSARRV